MIKVFFREFLLLFFKDWEARLDVGAVEWLDKEVFPEPPEGPRRVLDLVRAQLGVPLPDPRLEAGARVVSLNFSRWDWHGGDGRNFVESRNNMPLLDQGVSALVSDGCGKKELDSWLGNNPRLDTKASAPHAGPKMSELPAACRQVLLTP